MCVRSFKLFDFVISSLFFFSDLRQTAELDLTDLTFWTQTGNDAGKALAGHRQTVDLYHGNAGLLNHVRR